MNSNQSRKFRSFYAWMFPRLFLRCHSERSEEPPYLFLLLLVLCLHSPEDEHRGASIYVDNFRLTTLGPHHKTRHFDRRRRFCRRSGETRFSTSTLRQPASSNAASWMTDLTQVKSCQSRVQNLILTAVETPAIPAATQPFQPPRGPLEASSKSSRETLMPQPRAHPHQPEISSPPAPGSSGSQTAQAR